MEIKNYTDFTRHRLYLYIKSIGYGWNFGKSESSINFQFCNIEITNSQAVANHSRNRISKKPYVPKWSYVSNTYHEYEFQLI